MYLGRDVPPKERLNRPCPTPSSALLLLPENSHEEGSDTYSANCARGILDRSQPPPQRRRASCQRFGHLPKYCDRSRCRCRLAEDRRHPRPCSRAVSQEG